MVRHPGKRVGKSVPELRSPMARTVGERLGRLLLRRIVFLCVQAHTRMATADGVVDNLSHRIGLCDALHKHDHPKTVD